MIAQSYGGATMPADVQSGIASGRLRPVLLLLLQLQLLLLRGQRSATVHAAVQAAVVSVGQTEQVQTLLRRTCKLGPKYFSGGFLKGRNRDVGEFLAYEALQCAFLASQSVENKWISLTRGIVRNAQIGKPKFFCPRR